MSMMNPTRDKSESEDGKSDLILNENMAIGIVSMNTTTSILSPFQHHPPPSPLSGCYLLIVLPEPHTAQHKDLIINRLAKGFLSWDKDNCHVDLTKELQALVTQSPEGEEARNGERLIQYATENLVTEILIHPQTNTLLQCIRNLLASFTKHRHIIHAGYTFSENGSWILQDGTFSLADFLDAFNEHDVQRVLRAYENSVTLDINCAGIGDWSGQRLSKESCTRLCRIRLNPDDVLNIGMPAITNFTNYISQYLVAQTLNDLMQPSDVVGNIRFSHPTLYVFPGGQGDAALFGINGFNMLIDGGFGRKSCFWDFTRHLDRLDAVLFTRLNNSNIGGMSSVLQKKRKMHVYPQIGHFFCNLIERKHSNSLGDDKDLDPLILSLLDLGQEMMVNLKYINLRPHTCYRDHEPINLYHKVGHGTLDMYVLSPTKDSCEVRDFLTKWNATDWKGFDGSHKKDAKNMTFPIQNLISICALLVWQPANPDDTITRILFPGSTPQYKIFEGLQRLKHLEFLKHSTCTAKSVSLPVSLGILKDKSMKQKQSIIDKETKHAVELKTPKRENIDIKKIESISHQQQQAIIIKAKKLSVLENKRLDEGKDYPKIFTETKKIEKSAKETKKESKNDVSKTDKETEMKKPDATKSKTDMEKIAIPKILKSKTDHKKKEIKEIGKLTSKTSKSDLKSDYSANQTIKTSTPKKAKSEMTKAVTPKVPFKSSVKTTPLPAKSAKDANNRKVVEQKNIEKMSISGFINSTPKSLSKSKTITDKKASAHRLKPMPSLGKSSFTGSPSKSTKGVPNSMKSEKDVIIKKIKSGKGTANSSVVSAPSAIEIDATKLIDKCLTEQSEDMSLDSIDSKVLADLKEERQVAEEIEAVLQKAEKIGGAIMADELEGEDETTDENYKKEEDMTEDDVTADIDDVPRKELTSCKASQEFTEEDEYLIIEKEEMYTENSVHSGETEHKHILDAAQSEKDKFCQQSCLEKPEMNHKIIFQQAHGEDEGEGEEKEENRGDEDVDGDNEENEDEEKQDIREILEGEDDDGGEAERDDDGAEKDVEKGIVEERETTDELENTVLTGSDKQINDIAHDKYDIENAEYKGLLDQEMKGIITSAEFVIQMTNDKDNSGKKDSEDITKEGLSLTPEKFNSSEKKTTDTDARPEIDLRELYPREKLEESQERISTIESGATTTAPTLPEDERIPVEAIKSNSIDKQMIMEDVKRMENVAKIKIIPLTTEITEAKCEAKVFVARHTVQALPRDIVKTPDEVADLPVHEEVDPKLYDMDEFEKSKQDKIAEQKDFKGQKRVLGFFGKVADKFERGMDKLTGKSKRDSEKDIDEKSSSKSTSPKESTNIVELIPDVKQKRNEEIDQKDNQEQVQQQQILHKVGSSKLVGSDEVGVYEDVEEVEALLEEAAKKFKTVKDSLRDSLESLDERIIEEELRTTKSATAAENDEVKSTLEEVVEKLEEIKSVSPESFEKMAQVCTLKNVKEAMKDVGEVLAGTAGIVIENKSKDVEEIVKKVAEVLKEDKFFSEETMLVEQSPQPALEDFIVEAKLVDIGNTTDTSISLTIIDQQEQESTENERHKVPCINHILNVNPDISSLERNDDIAKFEAKVMCTDLLKEYETIVRAKRSLTDATEPDEIDVTDAGIAHICEKVHIHPIQDDVEEEPIDIKASQITFDQKSKPATAEMIVITPDSLPSSPKFPENLSENQVEANDSDLNGIEGYISAEVQDLINNTDSIHAIIERLILLEKTKITVEILEYIIKIKYVPRHTVIQMIEQVLTENKMAADCVIAHTDILGVKIHEPSADKKSEIEKYIDDHYIKKPIKITHSILEDISIEKSSPISVVIQIIQEIILKKGIPKNSILNISDDELQNIIHLEAEKKDSKMNERKSDSHEKESAPQIQFLAIKQLESELENELMIEYIGKGQKITEDFIDDIQQRKLIPRRVIIEMIDKIIMKKNWSKQEAVDISETIWNALESNDSTEIDIAVRKDLMNYNLDDNVVNIICQDQSQNIGLTEQMIKDAEKIVSDDFEAVEQEYKLDLNSDEYRGRTQVEEAMEDDINDVIEADEKIIPDNLQLAKCQSEENGLTEQLLGVNELTMSSQDALSTDGKKYDKLTTVRRMMVIATSEAGGEENELCTDDSMKFTKTKATDNSLESSDVEKYRMNESSVSARTSTPMDISQSEYISSSERSVQVSPLTEASDKNKEVSRPIPFIENYEAITQSTSQHHSEIARKQEETSVSKVLCDHIVIDHSIFPNITSVTEAEKEPIYDEKSLSSMINSTTILKESTITHAEVIPTNEMPESLAVGKTDKMELDEKSSTRNDECIKLRVLSGDNSIVSTENQDDIPLQVKQIEEFGISSSLNDVKSSISTEYASVIQKKYINEEGGFSTEQDVVEYCESSHQLKCEKPDQKVLNEQLPSPLSEGKEPITSLDAIELIRKDNLIDESTDKLIEHQLHVSFTLLPQKTHEENYDELTHRAPTTQLMLSVPCETSPTLSQDDEIARNTQKKVDKKSPESSFDGIESMSTSSTKGEILNEINNVRDNFQQSTSAITSMGRDEITIGETHKLPSATEELFDQILNRTGEADLSQEIIDKTPTSPSVNQTEFSIPSHIDKHVSDEMLASESTDQNGLPIQFLESQSLNPNESIIGEKEQSSNITHDVYSLSSNEIENIQIHGEAIQEKATSPSTNYNMSPVPYPVSQSPSCEQSVIRKNEKLSSPTHDFPKSRPNETDDTAMAEGIIEQKSTSPTMDPVELLVLSLPKSPSHNENMIGERDDLRNLTQDSCSATTSISDDIKIESTIIEKKTNEPSDNECKSSVPSPVSQSPKNEKSIIPVCDKLSNPTYQLCNLPPTSIIEYTDIIKEVINKKSINPSDDQIRSTVPFPLSHSLSNENSNISEIEKSSESTRNLCTITLSGICSTEMDKVVIKELSTTPTVGQTETTVSSPSPNSSNCKESIIAENASPSPTHNLCSITSGKYDGAEMKEELIDAMSTRSTANQNKSSVSSVTSLSPSRETSTISESKNSPNLTHEQPNATLCKTYGEDIDEEVVDEMSTRPSVNQIESSIPAPSSCLPSLEKSIISKKEKSPSPTFDFQNPTRNKCDNTSMDSEVIDKPSTQPNESSILCTTCQTPSHKESINAEGNVSLIHELSRPTQSEIDDTKIDTQVNDEKSTSSSIYQNQAPISSAASQLGSGNMNILSEKEISSDMIHELSSTTSSETSVIVIDKRMVDEKPFNLSGNQIESSEQFSMSHSPSHEEGITTFNLCSITSSKIYNMEMDEETVKATSHSLSMDQERSRASSPLTQSSSRKDSIIGEKDKSPSPTNNMCNLALSKHDDTRADNDRIDVRLASVSADLNHSHEPSVASQSSSRETSAIGENIKPSNLTDERLSPTPSKINNEGIDEVLDRKSTNPSIGLIQSSTPSSSPARLTSYENSIINENNKLPSSTQGLCNISPRKITNVEMNVEVTKEKSICPTLDQDELEVSSPPTEFSGRKNSIVISTEDKSPSPISISDNLTPNRHDDTESDKEKIYVKLASSSTDENNSRDPSVVSQSPIYESSVIDENMESSDMTHELTSRTLSKINHEKTSRKVIDKKSTSPTMDQFKLENTLLTTPSLSRNESVNNEKDKSPDVEEEQIDVKSISSCADESKSPIQFVSSLSPSRDRRINSEREELPGVPRDPPCPISSNTDETKIDKMVIDESMSSTMDGFKSTVSSSTTQGPYRKEGIIIEQDKSSKPTHDLCSLIPNKTEDAEQPIEIIGEKSTDPSTHQVESIVPSSASQSSSHQDCIVNEKEKSSRLIHDSHSLTLSETESTAPLPFTPPLSPNCKESDSTQEIESPVPIDLTLNESENIIENRDSDKSDVKEQLTISVSKAENPADYKDEINDISVQTFSHTTSPSAENSAIDDNTYCDMKHSTSSRSSLPSKKVSSAIYDNAIIHIRSSDITTKTTVSHENEVLFSEPLESSAARVKNNHEDSPRSSVNAIDVQNTIGNITGHQRAYDVAKIDMVKDEQDASAFLSPSVEFSEQDECDNCSPLTDVTSQSCSCSHKLLKRRESMPLDRSRVASLIEEEREIVPSTSRIDLQRENKTLLIVDRHSEQEREPAELHYFQVTPVKQIEIERYIVSRYVSTGEKITDDALEEIIALHDVSQSVVIEIIHDICKKKNIDEQSFFNDCFNDKLEFRYNTTKDNIELSRLSFVKRLDIENYITDEYVHKKKKLSLKIISEVAALKEVSEDIILAVIEYFIVKRNIPKESLIEDELWSRIQKDLAWNADKQEKRKEEEEEEEEKKEEEGEEEEKKEEEGEEEEKKEEEGEEEEEEEEEVDHHSEEGPRHNIDESVIISNEKRMEIEKYMLEDYIEKGKTISYLVLNDMEKIMSVPRYILLELITRIIQNMKLPRESVCDHVVYSEITNEDHALKDLSHKSSPGGGSSGYSTPEVRHYDDKIESQFHKAFIGGMTEIRTTHITTLSGKSTPDVHTRMDTSDCLSELPITTATVMTTNRSSRNILEETLNPIVMTCTINAGDSPEYQTIIRRSTVEQETIRKEDEKMTEGNDETLIIRNTIQGDKSDQQNDQYELEKPDRTKDASDYRFSTVTPEGFRRGDIIKTTITTTRTVSEEGGIITTTKEVTETTNEKGETTVMTEKVDVTVADHTPVAIDLSTIEAAKSLDECQQPITAGSESNSAQFNPSSTSHIGATAHAGTCREETQQGSDDGESDSQITTITSQVCHYEKPDESIEFSTADVSSSFYEQSPTTTPTRIRDTSIDYSDANEADDFTFKMISDQQTDVMFSSIQHTEVSDCDGKKLMKDQNVKNNVAAGDNDDFQSDAGSSKDPLREWGTPLKLPPPERPEKFHLRTGAIMRTVDTPSDSLDFDVIHDWGEPMQLPSPTQLATDDTTENKIAPAMTKKEVKQPKKVIPETLKNKKYSENPIKSDKKLRESRNKVQPIYLDLTYVPHHGNSYYASLEFFKRVRARYYVFSGIEPSREVYDALLNAKKTWENKNLEVTIIPTYDTDTLGYWVADNEEALAAHHIDLSPSASRCTINLQDHETSCSAYRLEF